MKTQHYLAVALTLLPALALAHPGHDLHAGFVAGVLHPLSGIDHLAVMLAVGICASLIGGHMRWVLPISFVAWMLVGAALGMYGLYMGAAEQGIAASVCLMGLLLAGKTKLPAYAYVLLINGFAVFHGYAHGVEAPQQVSTIRYMSGFVLSTIALHLAGLQMGNWLVRHQRQTTLRWAGAAMAVGGLVLFAG